MQPALPKKETESLNGAGYPQNKSNRDPNGKALEKEKQSKGNDG